MKRVVSALGIFVLAILVGRVSSAVTAEEALTAIVGNEADAIPFDSLKKSFNDPAAKAPEAKELKTWRTGRCFHIERKSHPLAGILYTVSENDGGPLVPEGEFHKMRVKARGDVTSGYYDRLSETAKQEVIADYLRTVPQLGRTRGNDGSLYSFYNAPNFPTGRRVKRITNGGETYYIALLSTNTEQTMDGHRYDEGTVFGACYFFAPTQLPNP